MPRAVLPDLAAKAERGRHILSAWPLETTSHATMNQGAFFRSRQAPYLGAEPPGAELPLPAPGPVGMTGAAPDPPAVATRLPQARFGLWLGPDQRSPQRPAVGFPPGAGRADATDPLFGSANRKDSFSKALVVTTPSSAFRIHPGRDCYQVNFTQRFVPCSGDPWRPIRAAGLPNAVRRLRRLQTAPLPASPERFCAAAGRET